MRVLEISIIYNESKPITCTFVYLRFYLYFTHESLICSNFIRRYLRLVKKHGLEISQPGLEPNKGLTWQMTKRRGDREVHK